MIVLEGIEEEETEDRFPCNCTASGLEQTLIRLGCPPIAYFPQWVSCPDFTDRSVTLISWTGQLPWFHGQVNYPDFTDRSVPLISQTGQLPWSWGSWWRCCCSPGSGPSGCVGWAQAASPWRSAPAAGSGPRRPSAPCRRPSAPRSPAGGQDRLGLLCPRGPMNMHENKQHGDVV